MNEKRLHKKPPLNIECPVVTRQTVCVHISCIGKHILMQLIIEIIHNIISAIIVDVCMCDRNIVIIHINAPHYN